MIPIYVRDCDAVDGDFLGEFEPEQVDTVIDLFEATKTRLPDGNMADFLAAQFVAGMEGSGGVYLEIVVSKIVDD